MSNNWTTYKLGEVLEIKYGKDHKHLEDGDIPVYGSGGIMRYANNALYDKPTILIPRKGTLSNLFYVDTPFWSVDTMFYTKIDESNNSKFIYYYLKTLNLASLNVGSAVPSLTTEVLNKVEINLPDIEVQNEIASILSSLDDKIELNNQMNKTLEDMAQAIFKEWFVDFNFPGFDGELVDGLPRGWRMGKVGELIKLQNGYAFKSKDFKDEGNYGVLKIKNISNKKVDIENTQFVNDWVSRFEVVGGDILIAMTGAEVGKIGVVPLNNKKLMLNQRVGKFCPIQQENKWYNYLFLTTDTLQNLLFNSASGSAQPNISASQIEDIDVLIPDNSVLQKFDKVVDIIFQRIMENDYVSYNIKELRDTLLPKLMSGKIEIKL